MPQIGPLEIAVVLLIALLVFGPHRLPELARQVGGALRELRKIQSNLQADFHEMMADEPAGAAPPPTLPPKDVPGPHGDATRTEEQPRGGPAGSEPATPPTPDPG